VLARSNTAVGPVPVPTAARRLGLLTCHLLSRALAACCSWQLAGAAGGSAPLLFLIEHGIARRCRSSAGGGGAAVACSQSDYLVAGNRGLSARGGWWCGRWRWRALRAALSEQGRRSACQRAQQCANAEFGRAVLTLDPSCCVWPSYRSTVGSASSNAERCTVLCASACCCRRISLSLE
jgi:hypothetical protein